MKAKLYEVTQGRDKEMFIASSKRDVDESFESSAMGSKKIEVIADLEVNGNKLDGITEFKNLSKELADDFGFAATIADEFYDALPE